MRNGLSGMSALAFLLLWAAVGAQGSRIAVHGTGSAAPSAAINDMVSLYRLQDENVVSSDHIRARLKSSSSDVASLGGLKELLARYLEPS